MTATSIQVEELLEYMGQHKDLARGLIHNVEGRARAKRLWEDLAARLNSLGGGVKSVKQWKKVWADKKYLAKRANAAARRSATGTGGGPPTAEQLSENDLRVITVMGEGFGEPDVPVARVLAFPEPLEQPTPTEDSEQEGQEEQHAWPGTAPAVPVQADTSNDLSALRLSGRRLPGRTLRAAPVPDIRTQILEIEEEKRDVLVGILKEVKVLNESIKKIIEKF